MLKIYGASDDLVEMEGCVNEEIGSYDAATTITIGGALVVTAQYGKDGGSVWAFTLRQVDEDVPLPWPVRVEFQHPYSLAAALDFAIETGAVVEFGRYVPPRYAVDEQERAYERALDELVMTAILERAEKKFFRE